MSIERTYYCEGPDCKTNATTATTPPYLPGGFIHVRQVWPGSEQEWHFCGWECAMKYGATKPPPEVIPWEGEVT